ncbi:MAG: LPS export ABC transporter periplasmic protein LptC [Pseudomonadota bacterium]
MADADNLHSQLVAWAKIVLPLCALALLSTLFLFARTNGEASDVTMAEVEAIAREQRVAAPEFSGLTDDGAVIVISAQAARPDTERPDTLNIDDIAMRMDNPDGSQLSVSATTGVVNGRAQSAQFIGLARLDSSAGYQMETNGLTIDLQSGTVTSNGLLEVRAPFGELTAGQVTFTIDGPETGQQIQFTEKVRLLYDPE